MIALSTFPPVSLDELVSETALLTRVDRKYLIPLARAYDILEKLSTETRILTIDGMNEFGYASMYFDTNDLRSFHSAATARRRRWKVRTRTYLDTSDCWLEVKTRGARGQTVKERIPHPVDQAHTLSPTTFAFVAERLRAAHIEPPDYQTLGPVLRTTYRRRTLALTDGQSRATFDTNLSWHSVDGDTLTDRNLAIIETKTGSTPSRLDRTLWAEGHRPTRISKFATGMAMLDSRLPAHRWHRLLSDKGPFNSQD